MAVGFVDPASLFGVGGERGGVDALRGQHRNRGGVGDEVGAVFADVDVGACALGLCSRQYPPARRDLMDRGLAPVVVVAACALAACGGGRGDGDGCAAGGCGHRPDLSATSTEAATGHPYSADRSPHETHGNSRGAS